MQNVNTIDNIYTIIGSLDCDSSSHMYKVRNVNNNTEYEAKVRVINTGNNFDRELQIATNASALNNPYIIHLNNHGIGTIANHGNIVNNKNYMIFDYCPKRELFRYIQLRRFDEKQAKYIFKKILNGVQALHGAGIFHADLRPENILLDAQFNPKISNFALSRIFRQNNANIPMNGPFGTRYYRAPQGFLNVPYNGDKADIFSLGVILFILVTHLFPFHSARNNDVYYQHIRNGNENQYWNILPNEIQTYNLSQEVKRLFLRMVAFNENDRPTLDQILADHWFDEIRNLDNQQLNQIENNVRNEFIARENELNNNNQHEEEVNDDWVFEDHDE